MERGTMRNKRVGVVMSDESDVRDLNDGVVAGNYRVDGHDRVARVLLVASHERVGVVVRVARHERVARQLRVARHLCVTVVVRDGRVCVVVHQSVGVVRLDLVVHLCSLQPVLVLFSIFLFHKIKWLDKVVKS